MKVGPILCVMLCVAVQSFAGSDRVFAPGPVNLPASRYSWYCQNTAEDWNAFNASSSFFSEEADDIPAEFNGTTLTEVTFYVAEWGAGWVNPTSITVNFYNAACPPGQTADISIEVPYYMCTASEVYAGSWYVYSVIIPLDRVVTIGPTTSIGGVVNQDWGLNAPYCGLVFSDPVQGCEGYWAGDYWGYPRWSPFSSYLGMERDLAYCLGGGGIGHDVPGACCFADGHCESVYSSQCYDDGGEYQGDGVPCNPNPCEPSPAKNTTWGKIKSDYR